MKNWFLAMSAAVLGLAPLCGADTDSPVSKTGIPTNAAVPGVGSPNPNLANPGFPNQRFTYGKIVMVDKVITVPMMQWRDETFEVIKKAYDIRPAKTFVMVPKYYDDVKIVTDIIKTPRVEIRDVPCCRMIPILIHDNCTGCCFIGNKPEPYIKKVPIQFEDTKLISRQVPVKVCRMTPQEVYYEQKVCRPVVETHVRRVPIYVPVQKTVRVPQCMPSDVPVPAFPGLPPHIPGPRY